MYEVDPQFIPAGYLSHHGVKGMRWGVRKKYHPSGNRRRAVPKRSESQFIARKGSEVQHIADRKFNLKDAKHLYATTTEYDKKLYGSFFAANKVLQSDKIKPIFQMRMQAKEDIISPNQKKRIDTFVEVFGKNKKMFDLEVLKYAKEFPEKDLSKMNDKELRTIGYRYFVDTMQRSQFVRDAYFGVLKQQGYNAIVDDFDKDFFGGAKQPLIVFDACRSLDKQKIEEVNVNKISKNLDDFVNYAKKNVDDKAFVSTVAVISEELKSGMRGNYVRLSDISDSELYTPMNCLSHHGIRGQKWGVKRGPPYPLQGGRVQRTKRKKPNKVAQFFQKRATVKKKYQDDVIRSGKDVLTTLSYDKGRTKNTDMFYAAWKPLDKHQYNALFNKKIPTEIYDQNGNSLGKSSMMKWRINNNVKSDVKVASEQSASRIFSDLYKRDRDFYNFVTDEKRMRSYFVEDKYKFRGYRESRAVLDKMKNDPKYTPSDKDVQKLYRMFNYVIPYDGGGTDAKGGQDVYAQRTKFFNAAKKEGYGALLDTNDALYGAFKATSPVIMFDMEKVIPKDISMTKMSEQKVSQAVLVGRKALGI